MSVERKVVLLTGPAGAGKSTALKTITDCRECLTFSFASPIKQMIKTLCPDADVHGKDKNTPLDALNGFSPRHAMQTLGTEWGRNCMGGDIWVKAAIEKVKAHDGTHLSVFDDARFPNEVSFMQDAFQTTVIKVVPEFDRYEPIESAHISEQHELPFNYEVKNYGDLDFFNSQIRDVIESAGL